MRTKQFRNLDDQNGRRGYIRNSSGDNVSVGGYRSDQWIYFHLTRGEIDTFTPASLANAINSPRYNYYAYKKPLTQIFVNRGYSQDFAENIVSFLEASPSMTSDAELISFQVLNEFLAQDAIDNYGDFLSSRWDELVDTARRFEFQEYPRSAELLKNLLGKSPLCFDPKAPVAFHEKLDSLSKKTMATLVFNTDFKKDLKPRDKLGQLNQALAVVNGEVKGASVTPLVNLNSLVKTLGMSMANFDMTKPMRLTFLFSQFNDAMEIASLSIKDKKTLSGGDKVFSGDLHEYISVLLRHASELSPSEAFLLSIMWDDIRLITRGGDREKVLAFLNTVLKSYQGNEEKELEFLRFMAETAAFSRDLPTILEWKKGHKSGLFDEFGSTELILILLVKGQNAPKPLVRHTNYRKALGLQSS